MIIAPDIEKYRELKLRLLNGTHTLSCGVAFLAGCQTVKQAMDNEMLSAFIADLMQHELAPSIPYEIDLLTAQQFGNNVLDRFRNPHIKHLWINITVQYSSKMKLRCIPVLLKHYEENKSVPEYFAIGFAAYILFMKAVKEKDGNYFGMRNADYYPIKDEKAAYFYEKWKKVQTELIAKTVLQDINLWGHDLSALPGFADAVQEKIDDINERGMATVLQSPAPQKIPV